MFGIVQQMLPLHQKDLSGPTSFARFLGYDEDVPPIERSIALNYYRSASRGVLSGFMILNAITAWSRNAGFVLFLYLSYRDDVNKTYERHWWTFRLFLSLISRFRLFSQGFDKKPLIFNPKPVQYSPGFQVRQILEWNPFWLNSFERAPPVALFTFELIELECVRET